MSETEIIELFGKNLRRVIQVKGRTMKDLSRMCDIPLRSLYRLAQGVAHPNVVTLSKLTTGLNIPVGRLFKGAQDEK